MGQAGLLEADSTYDKLVDEEMRAGLSASDRTNSLEFRRLGISMAQLGAKI